MDSVAANRRLNCILQDQQNEGKVLSRTAENAKTAKLVLKATTLQLQTQEPRP